MVRAVIRRALEPATVTLMFVAVACLAWRAGRGGDLVLSAGIVAIWSLGVLWHVAKTGQVRE